MPDEDLQESVILDSDPRSTFDRGTGPGKALPWLAAERGGRSLVHGTTRRDLRLAGSKRRRQDDDYRRADDGCSTNQRLCRGHGH